SVARQSCDLLCSCTPRPSALNVSSTYDTSTNYSYTLSLHDALPIFIEFVPREDPAADILRHRRDDFEDYTPALFLESFGEHYHLDRKSTRLNSSHVSISYAVFCLKKKTNKVRYRDTPSPSPSN